MNIVADDLNYISMASLSNLGIERNELARLLYQVAILGVRLLDVGDSEVIVYDTIMSSLVMKVKA